MMRWFIPWWLCAGWLLAGRAEGQTNAYHAIVERNAFGLKPAVPATAAAAPLEPGGDLLLTGLVEFAGRRQALFMVAEPGKPPSYFSLGEGQQNEWLEVKSVKVREGTVKVILKKRAVQMQNLGVEVVLSLAANGIKNRTVGDNTGHPLRNPNSP
jgi:hypothetical protein